MLALACAQRGSPTLTITSAEVVPDDGRAIRVYVSALDSTEHPSAGEVTSSSTAGVFKLPTQLVDGAAVGTFSCSSATDPACAGPVTLAVEHAGARSTRQVRVVRAVDAGSDAGSGDGGDGEGQADAGEGDAGMPSPLCPSDPRCWWRIDGGWYLPVADEPPDFDCSAWDGGPHPGYTFPDGRPSAVGCDGEPIDAVMIDTNTADSGLTVDLCGTVTLHDTYYEPVYPRGSYSGEWRFTLATTCCWRYYCLRDPGRLTYRIMYTDLQRLEFGLGVRTRGFARGSHGVFGSTPAVPITRFDGGHALYFDGGYTQLKGLDFYAPAGFRE